MLFSSGLFNRKEEGRRNKEEEIRKREEGRPSVYYCLETIWLLIEPIKAPFFLFLPSCLFLIFSSLFLLPSSFFLN
jgi:hypothetical protein